MGRDFRQDPCKRSWISAKEQKNRDIMEQNAKTLKIEPHDMDQKVLILPDTGIIKPHKFEEAREGGVVRDSVRDEHREETKCYKMGMKLSWEYERCREVQLSMPYLVEEFRYGDHGEHWAMGEDENWLGHRCFDMVGDRSYYDCVADTHRHEHYLKDRYITMMVQLAWGEFNWRPYGGAKLWTYS